MKFLSRLYRSIFFRESVYDAVMHHVKLAHQAVPNETRQTADFDTAARELMIARYLI